MTAAGAPDGRDLVVRHGDLEQMSASLHSAHRAFTQQLGDLLAQVDGHIVAWQPGTASRDAHDAARVRLQQRIDRTTAALQDLRTTLEGLAERARQAEVRNVAVID